MNKAVFLDRDGTINIDKDYVHKIEDWEFITRAVEALKILSDTGYKLFILTNQSGIARGYYGIKELTILHNYVLNYLKEKDVHITGIYFCPHHPKDGCACRKPMTGMAEKAVREFDIDISRSYFVGDKTCDIKLGNYMGGKTILVLTGKGGMDKEHIMKPDFTVKDIYEASKIILEGEAEK